jgi:hypothetical protein
VWSLLVDSIHRILLCRLTTAPAVVTGAGNNTASQKTGS